MRKNLRLILIHGTWSSSRSWANSESDFYGWLKDDLGKRFERFEVSPIEWSGSNRWRARTEVATELSSKLQYFRDNDNDEWEYLIVGHSHGGNIAVEGVREHLKKDIALPLHGVVCLNTPFLTQELRASNFYLAPWFFLTVIAAFLLQFSEGAMLKADPSGIVHETISLFGLSAITVQMVTGCLLFALAVLGALVFIGRTILKRRGKSNSKWGPRPPVLCLSCADDEAITLLGLGEGIANLPQLLFHPLALLILLALWGTVLGLERQFSWCGSSFECWLPQLSYAAILLSAWLLVATLGGLLGSLLIVVLFGLRFSLVLESMVSRVLVTYMPLKPADAYFRGIVDVTPTWSPLQLFHSQIYRSRSTVEEILEWLNETSPRFKERPASN